MGGWQSGEVPAVDPSQSPRAQPSSSSRVNAAGSLEHHPLGKVLPEPTIPCFSAPMSRAYMGPVTPRHPVPADGDSFLQLTAREKGSAVVCTPSINQPRAPLRGHSVVDGHVGSAHLLMGACACPQTRVHILYMCVYMSTFCRKTHKCPWTQVRLGFGGTHPPPGKGTYCTRAPGKACSAPRICSVTISDPFPGSSL